jgi:hypothetical protein
MDIENENDFFLTPPEIREAAEVASLNLLPEKSRKVYNKKASTIVVYLTSLCVNWAFFGTRGPF